MRWTRGKRSKNLEDRRFQTGGRRVSPDSFTHGSSEQRIFWLRRGLESGNPDACDTFSEMG